MKNNKRLIFKIDNLEKVKNNNNILNVRKLEIHPGTIYGIVGPVGSGKTTLLNLLSGFEASSKGLLLYDNNEFNKTWFGRIITPNEIFYNNLDEFSRSKIKVSSYIKNMHSKKINIIKNRQFDGSHSKLLWNRVISSLTKGEKNWLTLVLAIESDPRVLLVDDYGTYLDTKSELNFRSQLKKMNRNLGTTMLLTSVNDIFLKKFCSVVIYLDNGYVSKIRSNSYSKNKTFPKKRKTSFKS